MVDFFEFLWNFLPNSLKIGVALIITLFLIFKKYKTEESVREILKNNFF